MKRCKGFTLPETMLALLVFLVIAGAVGSVIVLGMNIAARSARNTSVRLLTDGIYDTLCQTLRYGNDLRIGFGFEDYPFSEARMIFIPHDGSGIVFCDGTDTAGGDYVFGEDILNGMKLSVGFSYSGASPDLVGVTVKLCEGNSEYIRSGTVKFMNNRGYTDIQDGVCSNDIGDVYIIYTDV
ncbi:MAG: type II secretion system protein [Oscillospiraceae bacterium]|nr:type II secretion system protein [Oscillospiraceae bacterium]